MTLEAFQHDRLCGVVIVAFNQMIRHCHLQGRVLTGFAAQRAPPALQAITALIGHCLIHQTQPGLLLQRITMQLIANLRFLHSRQNIQQCTPGTRTDVRLFGQAQHFRVTRRHFQQTVNAVSRRMIFVTSQLNTSAGNFNRNGIAFGQLSSTFKMLIGTNFIATLLGSFGGQQIVGYRHIGVIGIFRQQFLHLTVVAFCQLHQRRLSMTLGATALTAGKPAAGTRPGVQHAAQQPFHRQNHQQADDKDNHQASDAGFDIPVIGLNQHVALMTGNHRSQHHARNQQDKEDKYLKHA